MGNFGSLVFFGLAVGSVCATLIVSFFTWKQLLGISFLGNCLGLFLFAISSDYSILCFARFFSGFNQTFLTIYLPLYVDTYSAKGSKSVYMSFILLSPPIGVLLGYSLTAYCIAFYDNWRLSFYIQGFFMAFAAILLILIPTKYINIDEVARIRAQYNADIPETGGSGQVRSPFSQIEPGHDHTVGTMEAIGKLCQNFPYLCIVMCLTGLFFVISGI